MHRLYLGSNEHAVHMAYLGATTIMPRRQPVCEGHDAAMYSLCGPGRGAWYTEQGCMVHRAGVHGAGMRIWPCHRFQPYPHIIGEEEQAALRVASFCEVSLASVMLALIVAVG